MTPRWRISIRSKILILLSLVVVLAVTLYLYLASKIFYEDKTLLIYELNQTNVRTLGGEVEMRLGSILDQLRIWAVHGDPQIETDIDWARIAWMEKNPATGAIETKILKTWPERLAVFGKDDSFLERERARFPVPYEKILQTGVWVRNITLAPGKEGEEIVPLMTVAAAVKRAPPLADGVVFADVKLDRIASLFPSGGIAQQYLVDSEGYPLAAADQRGLVDSRPLDSDELIRAAYRSKVRSEVRKFGQDPSVFLGSFYRLSVPGMVVASKVESREAYSAATVLVRKSLLYALMVVTTALLVSLVFSYSLTVPIQRMVHATRQIAQGNFDLTVPISTRDELALLAASFNKMTKDLRSSRDQLEDYSRGLERKVEERTLAMREAQDALLRTTRLASVGEVAGRAAHEVLNPLTNITTRLEKIRNLEGASDDEDLRLFREITGAWSQALAGATGAPAESLLRALSEPSKAFPGKTLLEEDLGNLAAVARDLESRRQVRRTDLDFLLKEADRISKIVNGMRQLTRVASTREMLDVHRLIDETFAAMADLFQKNGIGIEKGYCAGSPMVRCDHDELLQVFSNLFRNSLQAALDARNKGAAGPPARIWVTTQTVSAQSGPRVRIRVCDNGPGIAEKDFHAIFEPSFTTKKPEEGTGLGLAICRRFIRALDGEITLEASRPGKETVFLIDLPESQSV